MVTNRNELVVQYEMLKGNINRMCVTDDIDELERIFIFAKNRLEEIYQYNKSNLMREEV